MIGQSEVLKWVECNLKNFPHFIVIVGLRGSGKKTLAKYISNKLSLTYVPCENKVEAARDVINTATQTLEKCMYCFEDADNMRAEAKNALLKITEEPPENAYFCMTVSDDSMLLDTIKSRAQMIYMDKYTVNQIDEYARSKYTFMLPAELGIVNLVCDTPGDVDIMCNMDIQEFYDYIHLVVDNIAEVESANAFKSASKLALKNDEGYDLRLFFNAFTVVCMEQLYKLNDVKKASRWADGILVAQKYSNNVDKLGVNKQQLYDNFVFDIRQVWY